MSIVWDVTSHDSFPALVAAGVGVVTAAVFIVSGEAAKPNPVSHDEPQCDEGSADDARSRRKAKEETKAKVAKKTLEGLSPESLKVLEEWQKSSSQDATANLAIHCLAILLFVGMLTMLTAYLISQHQVNLLSPETWADPMSAARKVYSDLGRTVRATRRKPAHAHDMEL